MPTPTPPFLIISWCPGSGCDPCSGGWKVFPGSESFVTNPDGSIPVEGNFRYDSFFLGLGLISSDAGANPGDIVNGYLDIGLSGRWVGALPPARVPIMPDPVLLVNANDPGIIYGSFDPVDGAITGFSSAVDFSTHDGSGSVVQTGPWGANSRLTIPNCIQGDPSTPDGVSLPYNCIMPLPMITLPPPTTPPDPPANISNWADYLPTLTESGLDSLGQEIVANHGNAYNSDGAGHWIIDRSTVLVTYQNASAISPVFIFRH